MEMIQRSPDLKDSSGDKDEKKAGIKLEDISLFEKKDFYARLAVHPEADMEDVNKAYRRKSMQFHPDRTDGNQELEKNYGEIMKLINLAYETLSDADKRKKYDVMLSGKPTQSREVQNTPKLSEQEIQDKVKTFATTCDNHLEEHGSLEGMNRIITIMKNYIRLGVPEQGLSQVIMPSMRKYFVNFAEKKLSKGKTDWITTPDRLVPEIMGVVIDFQKFILSQDIAPQFKKLIKKELILDYWKRFIISDKNRRGLPIFGAKSQVLRLSDSISEQELTDIENKVRFR
ncbi:MAG: Chaperone protein DnaJ [Candidatus Parcubacteria bacterium]